ncbi:hypothetical protein AJ87_24090 [Rhizobium yanglingense]|nr:hypothetical protein AJ87_24090 [Rhizobium yanglingense]
MLHDGDILDGVSSGVGDPCLFRPVSNGAWPNPLQRWGSKPASAQVALITTLEAPLSPLWVWLFFDDRPKIATVLGGALVLCTTTSYLLAEWRQPSGSGKQHEDAKRDGIR